MKQSQNPNQSVLQEIVVDFSKLSDEEKDTYIKHLMVNYPQMQEMSNTNNSQIDEFEETVKLPLNNQPKILQGIQSNYKVDQNQTSTSRSKGLNRANSVQKNKSTAAFTPAKTKRIEHYDGSRQTQNTDRNNENRNNIVYSNESQNMTNRDSKGKISSQQQQQDMKEQFMYAPSTNRESEQNTQRNKTPRIMHAHKQSTSINKVCIQSSQIALNQIVVGSQENYPLFYSFVKQVDKWIRPKRLSKDQTQKLIEEVYTSKFQKETQPLLSGKSNLKTQSNVTPFPQFVYELFKKKFVQQKQLEQNIANMLASIEFYSLKQPEIRLFQYFDDDDLIFFLFARAISEKVVGVEYYQYIRKKYLDPSLIFVNLIKAQNIATMVYGDTDKDNLENALYNIKRNSDFDPSDNLNKRERKISIYKILIILISLYSNNNQLVDPSTTLQANTRNINRDQNISKISERLESFITSPIYSNNKFNTHGSVEKQFLSLEKDMNQQQPPSFINNDQFNRNQKNGAFLNFEDQLYDGESKEKGQDTNRKNQAKDYGQRSDKKNQSFTQQERDILKNISLLDQRIQQRSSQTNETPMQNAYNGVNSFRAFRQSLPENNLRAQSDELNDKDILTEDSFNKLLINKSQDIIHDSKEQEEDEEEEQNDKNDEEYNDNGEKEGRVNKKQGKEIKYQNPFLEGLTYKSEFQIEQELKKQEEVLKKQKEKIKEQEEEEQYESENYQIEMKSENQQIVFMNVHQRLEEFIEVMIMDSSHLPLQDQQSLKDKLYDVISRRVNDLLASIFNQNPWIWLRSCSVQEPTPFQLEYLQELFLKYLKILAIPAEKIEKIELNQLSKKILQTPELAKEIGRLIVNLTINE